MKIPFKVGEALTLEEKKSEEHIEQYHSRIADFNQQHILIEMPISNESNKIGYFPDGFEMNIVYWYEGAKYEFTCSVLGRKYDSIPLTVLSLPFPDSISRIQRRNFVRVPSIVEVAIHPAYNRRFDPFLTKTLDISGGGMAFTTHTSETLNVGDRIEWWLAIPLSSGEIRHPHGTGRIVRIIEPDEDHKFFRHSVEFLDIKKADEELIIKYCFERQLELKRKFKKS